VQTLDRKDAERDAKGQRLLSKIPAALFGCVGFFTTFAMKPASLPAAGRESRRVPISKRLAPFGPLPLFGPHRGSLQTQPQPTRKLNADAALQFPARLFRFISHLPSRAGESGACVERAEDCPNLHMRPPAAARRGIFQMPADVSTIAKVKRVASAVGE